MMKEFFKFLLLLIAISGYVNGAKIHKIKENDVKKVEGKIRNEGLGEEMETGFTSRSFQKDLSEEVKLKLKEIVHRSGVGNKKRVFPSTTGGCPNFPLPVSWDSIKNLSIMNETFDMVDQAAQIVFQNQKTVGASVAIVYNQTIIWEKGYGTVNISEPENTPTLDSVYRMGSISKVFTTIGLMLLRDAGLVHLDDQVADFFPTFQPQTIFPSKRGITFRQLATHLSGLPREDPCTYCINVTNSIMWERASELNLILPTDALPVYSNFGFNCLGNMMADISNQTFEDFLYNNITQPLGLDSTGVNFTSDVLNRIATGYTNDYQPVTAYDYGWPNPAGGIYSTARDIASLMKFFFRSKTPADIENGQLLDGSTIREMMKIQFIDRNREDGFALPFELYYLNDYLLRTKRGDVTGWASEMIMVDELKLGLVVLANMEENAQGIAQAAMGVLLPRFEGALWAAQEELYLPTQYKDYVGNFTAPNNGGFLDITLTAGSLVMNMGFPSIDTSSGTLREYNETAEIYEIVPLAGNLDSCINNQLEDFFQTVQFLRNSTTGEVTTAQMTGINWGITYTKKQ